MKKCVVGIVIGLLASTMQGMDGIEFLKKHPWFDVVSVTSTNLILKVKSGDIGITQSHGTQRVSRRSSEYIENNEDLVLFPDQETSTSDGWHASLFFKPVNYKTN
jgi:hypothetical protein